MTLTALAVALAALGYVATTQDVLEEGRDKRRVYAFMYALVERCVDECTGERMLPLPASSCFQ